MEVAGCSAEKRSLHSSGPVLKGEHGSNNNGVEMNECHMDRVLAGEPSERVKSEGWFSAIAWSFWYLKGFYIL